MAKGLPAKNSLILRICTGYERVSLIRDIECTHCRRNFEAGLEDYLNYESSDERENARVQTACIALIPKNARSTRNAVS